MTPSQMQYPDFVPDQLLTSENLNDLFLYLDEQGRMTRTNLIGIGIVCGLEVKTAADGTSIKVTKGTGVTSEGYLVAMDEAIYTQYLDFDPTLEIVYDRFFKVSPDKKMDLWELKQTAAVEGAKPLTFNWLNGEGVTDNKMVVALFVELLQVKNKNCNPESCDDKGVTIKVNLRPLLMRKGQVDSFNLKPGISGSFYNSAYASLSEMHLRRVEPYLKGAVSSGGLLSAYKKIMTPTFIQSTEDLLTGAWTIFKPVVGIEFGGVNPFQSLSESFAYINNGTISAKQLTYLQYSYDFFSDLLAAYAEFRRTGLEILHTCCPDSGLFPRHLLLDYAIANPEILHSAYRQPFLHSPLFQKKDLINRLRSLFRRMALMVAQYRIPDLAGSTNDPDDFIRLTPSRLDAIPLSSKAIPYYFDAVKPLANPLYKHWNYEKTEAQDVDENHGYQSGEYSGKEYITQALKFDLEPFNFLRIEGHVGKGFAHVIGDLKKKVKENQLPIDIIGLALSDDATGTEILDPKALEDLQVQYEVLKAETICCLKRQAKFWGSLNIKPNFAYGGLAYNADLMYTPQQPAYYTPAPSSSPEKAVKNDSKKIQAAPLALSRKEDMLSTFLDQGSSETIFQAYRKFQSRGDYNLSRIPAPNIAFDDSVISHFSLQILDEVGELLLLLEAENPMTLDIEALSTHGESLQESLSQFVELLDQEMTAKKPFQKIKAYVGEAQYPRVDAIRAAMPDLGEANAGSVVLLLLNLSEAEKTSMVNQLTAHRGHLSAQQAILKGFIAKLDKDGMMIPATRPVDVVEDPFLKGLRDRAQNFTCLCTLTGFRKLRELMQKIILDLKKENLFSVFLSAHPGMQHKAGVTMGGTFIVVYHRKEAKATDSVDPIYGNVSKNFPDGIVVADFFLPYLCLSNRQPIVYQISEGESAPVKVDLEFTANPKTGNHNFSLGDESSYPISHDPNGGSLTGGTVGNGVITAAADTFFFLPAKVKGLAPDKLKLDLVFKYVKKGVSSPEVKVTVYNLPTADITLGSQKTEVYPGSAITLIGASQFGSASKWTVKDATGKTTEISTAKDLKNYNLEKEGVFDFSLLVTQNETGAQAISNSVRITVIKAKEEPTKSCASLSLILAAYSKLGAKDSARFKLFDETVLKKIGIRDFFAKLGTISKLNESQQIAFFQSMGTQGTTFADTLRGWLDNLARAISLDKGEGFRELSLAAYKILIELGNYVNCIRKQDLGKIDEQVYTNMLLHIGGRGRTKGFVGLPQITDAEKLILQGMEKAFAAEIKRQEENSKVTPKPKFLDALKAVLAVF